MASETNSQNRPRVSQRQPTTHEPADGKPSRRAWVAFSIRKSSALARLIAHHRGSPQPPLCATRSLTPGVRIASGTAAKYSSRAALWLHRVSWCFSRVPNTRSRQARSWFGTKRPQVQILSPRPVPQVSDLRECRASGSCAPLQPPSRRPEGTKKEHQGTPGKADSAAQEGSWGHSDHPASYTHLTL